jgi:hypothetical protein
VTASRRLPPTPAGRLNTLEVRVSATVRRKPIVASVRRVGLVRQRRSPAPLEQKNRCALLSHSSVVTASEECSEDLHGAVRPLSSESRMREDHDEAA